MTTGLYVLLVFAISLPGLLLIGLADLRAEKRRLVEAEERVEQYLTFFDPRTPPDGWQRRYDLPTIANLCDAAYANAKEKGFYDRPVDFGTRIALMHEELSEALAEYRNNKPYTLVYTNADSAKPEGIPIELADCAIRIFDAAGYYKIDLQAAILRKMAYNATRPYRHGNKAA